MTHRLDGITANRPFGESFSGQMKQVDVTRGQGCM